MVPVIIMTVLAAPPFFRLWSRLREDDLSRWSGWPHLSILLPHFCPLGDSPRSTKIVTNETGSIHVLARGMLPLLERGRNVGELSCKIEIISSSPSWCSSMWRKSSVPRSPSTLAACEVLSLRWIELDFIEWSRCYYGSRLALRSLALSQQSRLLRTGLQLSTSNASSALSRAHVLAQSWNFFRFAV